jgi:UDP-N-acetylglucosamine--N-acetylmuramyl-(pentapeptide) pyrophosphoryl-undecaprenol N-acetylglucosamine transferase
MSPSPIVLAAGGTGGHIFPAESLAEELVAAGHRVVFITDRRFRDYNNAGADSILSNIPIHLIHAASPGGGLLRKVRAGADISLGLWQARKLLRSLQPRAVVGFGGYPSFPTMLAASQLKLNTIIHEQNSVLGRANRALVRRVRHIATTYTDMQRMPLECRMKTVMTGNPVRGAVRVLNQIPYAPPQQDGTLRLLITGGSQGAHIFSDVLPEAVKMLPDALRQRLRIDQQCRADAIDKTRAAYRELGIQVDVAPFFTDLAVRLASAHLVICRAGASTVAELTCAGRPAILVPYPSATDNHQYFNAQAIEDAEGGWVMPQEGFTPAALSARLESFLNLPGSLATAAKQMRTLGKPDAAKRLAELVLKD